MEIMYVKYARKRKKQYKIFTEVIRERGGTIEVRKIALTEEAKQHIDTIAENCEILTRIYGKKHVAQSRILEPGILQMEYIEGETLQRKMMERFIAKDYDGFISLFSFYYQNILLGEEEFDRCISYNFTDPERRFNLDLLFENVIWKKNGDFVLIDYEWMGRHVYKKYILWRALFYMYFRYQMEFQQADMTLEQLLEGGGIDVSSGIVDVFHQKQAEFYQTVCDLYMDNYAKKKLRVNIK